MMRARWVIQCAAALAVVIPCSSHADVPRARPEDEGFSAQRLASIDRFYTERIDKGDIAGIVTLIARHGQVVHFSALGFADREKQHKMQTDTLFRVYSQTKAVTSTALMMLYEEGRFQLTDPVSKYIPEFAHLKVLRTPDSALNDTVALERPPTIQDLMRHTAGFSHGGEKNAVDQAYLKAGVLSIDDSLAQMMTKLAPIPLLEQPGKRFIYSIGPDIQARLVEILSGMPFDVFLETRLFKPLGMNDTGFWVPKDKRGRLATLYWTKDDALVPADDRHGYPTSVDPLSATEINGYTVDHTHKGGSGVYGLVSTAEDYWRFAQMLLNGGELNGVRILSPDVVHFMARDHLGSEMPRPDGGKGMGFGLGFAVVKDAAAMGSINSDGTFFWGGAAGTAYWIDPKTDTVILVMTQQLVVPRAAEAIGRLPPMVYGALTE